MKAKEEKEDRFLVMNNNGAYRAAPGYAGISKKINKEAMFSMRANFQSSLANLYVCFDHPLFQK